MYIMWIVCICDNVSLALFQHAITFIYVRVTFISAFTSNSFIYFLLSSFFPHLRLIFRRCCPDFTSFSLTLFLTLLPVTPSSSHLTQFIYYYYFFQQKKYLFIIYVLRMKMITCRSWCLCYTFRAVIFNINYLCFCGNVCVAVSSHYCFSRINSLTHGWHHNNCDLYEHLFECRQFMAYIHSAWIQSTQSTL